MPPKATKTLHPLPFEHLEPRRFEDLIRQLAYDFRSWRTLEATGRSGRDEGYDIRGWEIVYGADTTNGEPVDPDDDEEIHEVVNERQWLFQCKREKSIGPKKLAQYLAEIPDKEINDLYGLVFAVSCDISKASRDMFRTTCRNSGISECYIWSRGELEDMLFQPKNDGLLFAYFAISLRIRKRSLRAAIRSRLTIKRKIYRAFDYGEYLNREALFLDPEDTNYPYIRDDQKWGEQSWRIYTIIEHHPLGIMIQKRKYFAFLGEDGKAWDMADIYDDGIDLWQNPWANEEEEQQHRKTCGEVRAYRSEHFDKRCQGMLIVSALLKYDDIIEVDKDGDSAFKNPIIYVTFDNSEVPFAGTRTTIKVAPILEENKQGRYVEIAPAREIIINTDLRNRIVKFPDRFRKND